MKLRLTATLLSACFLMSAAGCSDSKEEPTISKGRYIEEEMGCIGYVSEMSDFFMEDGKISFLDRFGMKVYQETKNKNMFNASRILSVDSFSDEQSIINSAVSPDGTLFFDCNNSKTTGYSYALISKDDQFQNIEIELDDSLSFVSYVYGNDGTLYGVDYNGAFYEINVNTQKAVKLCDFGAENTGTVYKLDCAGDYLIAAASDKILFYDYKNKALIDTPQTIADFWSKNITADSNFDFCEGEENSFYIVCESGLFRYVMDGALIEQLIDGYSCHLGNPSYTIRSVICDEDAFIVSFAEGNFFRYHYDAEAINEITSILKIYSLEKSDTLLQIISEYQVQYPTVRIDYEVGMRSGMTYDDAMKNLTTSILSDNAPDIIMLDGLDIDNLEENNILLDLSEYEDTWNPDDILLDNVAKWNNEGGLYSVTCKFRIPTVAANKEILDKINSFTDLADQSEFLRKNYDERYPIIYFDKPETIIRLGLMYGGTAIFVEDNWDRDNMESFFDNCNRLFINDQHNSNFILVSSSMFDNVSDENRFAMRLSNCLGSDHTIAAGTVNAFMSDLNIAESIENCQNIYNVDYKFGISDGSKSFIPNCNLAVAQSDRNQTDALNFIALALNIDTQKTNLNDGFPVNTETLEWFYEKNKGNADKEEVPIYDYSNNLLEDFPIEWMDDDEVSEFNSYIHTLDEPIVIDSVTRSMIEAAGNRCFEGSITPAEAADEVIKQLELRRKE